MNIYKNEDGYNIEISRAELVGLYNYFILARKYFWTTGTVDDLFDRIKEVLE